jgi:hypothetical protein
LLTFITYEKKRIPPWKRRKYNLEVKDIYVFQDKGEILKEYYEIYRPQLVGKGTVLNTFFLIPFQKNKTFFLQAVPLPTSGL